MKNLISNTIKELERLSLFKQANILILATEDFYSSYQDEINVFRKLEEIAIALEGYGLYDIVEEELSFPEFSISSEKNTFFKSEESITGYSKKAILIGLGNFLELFKKQYVERKFDNLSNFEQDDYGKISNEIDGLIKSTRSLTSVFKREDESITKGSLQGPINKIFTIENQLAMFREQATRYIKDVIKDLESKISLYDNTKNAVSNDMKKKFRLKLIQFKTLEGYFDEYSLERELAEIRKEILLDFIKEKRESSDALEQNISFDEIKKLVNELVHLKTAEKQKILEKYADDSEEKKDSVKKKLEELKKQKPKTPNGLDFIHVEDKEDLEQESQMKDNSKVEDKKNKDIFKEDNKKNKEELRKWLDETKDDEYKNNLTIRELIDHKIDIYKQKYLEDTKKSGAKDIVIDRMLLIYDKRKEKLKEDNKKLDNFVSTTIDQEDLDQQKVDLEQEIINKEKVSDKYRDIKKEFNIREKEIKSDKKIEIEKILGTKDVSNKDIAKFMNDLQNKNVSEINETINPEKIIEYFSDFIKDKAYSYNIYDKDQQMITIDTSSKGRSKQITQSAFLMKLYKGFYTITTNRLPANLLTADNIMTAYSQIGIRNYFINFKVLLSAINMRRKEALYRSDQLVGRVRRVRELIEDIGE